MAHVRGAGAPSSETGQLPGNPEAAGREADRALPTPSGSQSCGWRGVGRSGPSGSIWHCLERTLTCSRGWASGQTGGEHPTVCGTAPGTRGPRAFLIPAPGVSAGAAGTHDNIWGHSWPSRLGRGVMRAPPGPPREQARGSQCQASHAEEHEELQKGMTPAPSFISGEDAPKSGTPPHPTSRLPTSVGAGAGVSPTPRVRLRLRVNTRFPRAPAPAACNRGSVPLRGHPGGELLLLFRRCHDPDTLDRELGKGLWTGWTSFTGLLCTQGRNFNDKARCRPDGADRHRSAEHTSWLSPTRF